MRFPRAAALAAALAAAGCRAPGPSPAAGPRAAVRLLPLRLAHDSKVNTLAFSPDGRTLYTGDDAGVIRAWDTRGGALRWRRDPPPAPPGGRIEAVSSLAVSPDGLRLALAAGPDVALRPADGTSGVAWTAAALHPGGATSVAFSPDGRTVATGGWDRRVALLAVATGKVELRLEGHEAQVLSIAFSPDGRVLASAGLDRSVRLWNPADGSEIQKVKGPGGRISAVAFSPDGRSFAVARLDRTIAIHETSTGRPIQTLSGVPERAQALAFSPDGRFLATGSIDGLVQVWSLLDGGTAAVLSTQSVPLTAVAFSPDGRSLAATSVDLTAVLWDLSGRLAPPAPVALPGEPVPLDAAWRDLEGEDATTAYHALSLLCANPAKALPFLRERLRPRPPDPAEVERLLQGLDDEDFPAREAASQRLASLGFSVEKRLRQVLAGTPSPEVRDRVQKLLDALEVSYPIPPGPLLARLRGVQALERIGTPEALALLDEIAAGPPSAPETADARAAAERLRARKP